MTTNPYHVELEQLQPQRVAVVRGHIEPAEIHVGDYGAVSAAYDVVAKWIGANGYVSAGEPWESSLDGPEVAEPRTVVRFPCHLA